MDKPLVAVSHPGKMGDALYALPAIRVLIEDWNAQVDFYTSEYCKPLEKLIKYQTGIRNFIVPESYTILGMDMGIRPWKMPVDGTLYNRIVHLGFRSVPDCPLPEFIGRTAGVPLSKLKPIYYEYPTADIPSNDYICIAPRGETTFKSLFEDIIVNSEKDVAIIGGKSDNSLTRFSTNEKGRNIFDLTGLDMLDTLTWMSKCSGFVGLMSAMLVLANGFDIPRIAVHDGIHWDMRHVLYSNKNHYPINPTRQEIEELLNL